MTRNFYYNDKFIKFLSFLENQGIKFRLVSLAKYSRTSLTSFYNWRAKKKAMTSHSYEWVLTNLDAFFAKEAENIINQRKAIKNVIHDEMQEFK